MHGSCKDVHDFTNSLDQCAFVRNTSACLTKSYIQYTEVLYCTFEGDAAQVGGIILYFSWMVFLFVGLLVVAQSFMCPNLEVISQRTLR